MSERGIGIFGGSFDPVHKGHKKLALFMCEKLLLEKMLIIPTAMSPFKNTSAADSEHRKNMCSLEFYEDFFEVSDIEIKRSGKSYTVDTVKSVKEKYPDKKLYLIVGSDQFLSFNRWYKFDEILKDVTLCAVTREGEVKKEELEVFGEKNLAEFGEYKIFEFEPLEISSTKIREYISRNIDTSRFLSENVAEYIRTEGLYKNE